MAWCCAREHIKAAFFTIQCNGITFIMYCSNDGFNQISNIQKLPKHKLQVKDFLQISLHWQVYYTHGRHPCFFCLCNLSSIQIFNIPFSLAVRNRGEGSTFLTQEPLFRLWLNIFSWLALRSKLK